MPEPKLTPWFVNGEKPVHPGVYNVSCEREGQSGTRWQMFNGQKWAHMWRKSPERAGHMPGEFGENAPASWRGLAEKPE